jgi:hypothetical protein
MAAMYRAELSTSRRRNGMAPVARQSKNDSRRRRVVLTDTLQVFCGVSYDVGLSEHAYWLGVLASWGIFWWLSISLTHAS